MELRWGLLIVGLFVLLGVYVFSKYRRPIKRGLSSLLGRLESAREGAAIEAPESQRIEPGMPAEPEPRRGEESLIDASPKRPSSPAQNSEANGPTKIVALRLMSQAGGFAAERLVLALRDAGFRHGQYGIFHRPSAADESRTDFSVASLIEPGAFDLTRVKTDSYPGVSIFLALPAPDGSVEVFDDMLKTSRLLAEKLDGEILDEQGIRLSIQRERYMREEVIRFEHQVK